jgi:hypothetical protein
MLALYERPPQAVTPAPAEFLPKPSHEGP